ncbi:SLF2 protein, partial [Alectura lathami]|nr:SLF2 protein [Alectura lathami]
RSQSITEFFKPVLKQDLGRKDRSVLCSSDTGNVKDAGAGLSVLRTEWFEKKISSAKKFKRKKMPDQTPSTSPTLGAFRRGIKEKKGKGNVLESSGVRRALGSLYPRVVIKKLLINTGSPRCFLAKKDKAVKPEEGKNEEYLGVTRTPLSCGSSWEQNTDCMDLEETSAGSDRWVCSEADAQKACARSSGSVSSTSLCRSPGLTMKLPCSPPDSALRAALGALHKGGRQEKRGAKRSKTNHMKPFSRAGASHQGNGSPLRGIPRSGLSEPTSDDLSQPKQVTNDDTPSPKSLTVPSEKAACVWSSQPAPLGCLAPKVCPGLPAQRGWPGKRKRVAASGCGQPAAASPNGPACRSYAEGRDASVLASLCGSAAQLAEGAALPRHDPARSGEYLDSSHENERNNYSVGLPLCSAQCPNENKQVSVVDTKENQLQVAHSLFFLEESLLSSQEDSTVLPSLQPVNQTNTAFAEGVKRHLQNAALSCMRPEGCAGSRAESIPPSNVALKTGEKTPENASDSCSIEGSRKLSVSEESGGRVSCLLPFERGCEDKNSVSLRLTGEGKAESTCTEMSNVNGKAKSSIDNEDKALECALDDDDDDDDDEPFVPLQEILSSSSRLPTKALEGDSLDTLSQGTMALNLHLSKPPVVTQVSYVNSLEHLLKEKEQSKRLDELERLLQEGIQGKDTDSSDGEDENAMEHEDLSEEHRAFIRRFSVTAHAIPDYHPGEDIFDLSVSGKIFNQHDLDLRNFNLIPQNPIEKLLLRSNATQQLFLALHGFLSCSYSCSVIPTPILKWLFQMMSIHPSYCVSTQILNKLIEITLKNAAISDEQAKPWIPSLADVSTVLVNMGVTFRSLFPLQHLQPNFNECDILSQMQGTVSREQPRGVITPASPAICSLPESNLINVIKFLDLCTTVVQDGYTDQEILLLLLLLFKISLEKQLKHVPLIDFQCLFTKLLMSIKDWDTKMPELCLALSDLCSLHHNLLWLVQMVPSWIMRGREVRRHLSLVIIGKLLNKKHIRIPDDSDKQMSLLLHYLVYMKPSNLLEKMRKGEQQNVSEDHVHTELEQEVYYLIYILLHLVSEASFFDTVNSSQRQHLLKLCGALDKHIKCDIREDARLFYRTKVKDLVARIYGKWQDMIQNSQPAQ